MDAAALDELLGGSAREREESWRYSKNAIRALSQQTFALADPEATLSAATIAQIDLPMTRGCRIVVVNGEYSERYSDVTGLDQATRVERDSARTLRITLAADKQALHLVFASVPQDSASQWQASYELQPPANGANLIEQHVAERGADVFGALTSQITLGAQAHMQATIFSDLPDSASLLHKSQCQSGAGSRYSATHVHVGGRLQRIESSIDLAGVDASCRSRGVFALRGREHMDIHLDVRHNARDTRSDLFWRGVADQRARGIFHGAITVAAGADGADAALSNKNLLLSANAEIDTQPALEIYADEVKASHGATVGQLDERVMFYLRSRGIAAATARNLLITAFCHEVFGDVADTALRDYLDAVLAARLPATATP